METFLRSTSIFVGASIISSWKRCPVKYCRVLIKINLKTLSETEHKVVAVADRLADDALKFATTHSIPCSYGSHDELLKDPRVDVVYIGTIHVTHRDIALMVMKAVLCEKPMTMRASDTKEMIDEAREKNLFLMEETWMRFFPAIYTGATSNDC